MANYKTTPDFTTTYPILNYELTRHKLQTTKLHLILTSNVQFEIGKGHVDASKVQNYETTPDFATTYINFV